MARLNMVEAIDQALLQEMRLDAKVIVLGEDVGRDGGVFRVTDGLVGRFGEERVIDTPLAESGIVGMAIGMAVAGFRPVAEIQFFGFSYPAYDQLVSHASRMRNRSRGQFTVPLVVRMPYGGGIRALEHHSESMEAVFAHVPGLKVVIPADPYEAKGLLAAAVRDPDPVVFMEPARIYRAIKADVPEEPYTLPLGKARVVREGRDVTALAWGAHVRTLKEAAQRRADVVAVRLRDRHCQRGKDRAGGGGPRGSPELRIRSGDIGPDHGTGGSPSPIPGGASHRIRYDSPVGQTGGLLPARCGRGRRSH
jgi:pyruvate dehydrogenase E1 component beta subunit